MKFYRSLIVAISLLTLSPVSHAVPAIGVNKFDLFSQYVGTASGCAGEAPCRRVTRAMAKKSLDDAKDAGVRFVRVSMSGPTIGYSDHRNSLALWRSDPDRFWRMVDEMMDDLDSRSIQIVPVLMWGGKKFPVMVGESVGDLLKNEESKSWKLLSAFVTDFITRYRDRPTVLFYELTNEFNGAAELDHDKRCAKPKHKRLCEVKENFTTDEMIAFTKRFASLIRKLDDTRKISSGFTVPRGAAEHLRAQPEWSKGGPDWTPDTREQFIKNLIDIHDGVDIISIHLYGGDRNKRFGAGSVPELLEVAKEAADKVGKPLFVGEFGEVDPTNAKPTTHTSRMIDKITELDIPYSAVWVWEFYQSKPHLTHNTRPSRLSLEPGYTDYLIGRIRAANRTGAAAAVESVRDNTPPRAVLTWPLECAVVKRGQTVYAVASDDSGKVDKVEFWLDDRMLGKDETQPYSMKISVSPGGESALLKARAYDVSGNMSEYETKITQPVTRKACLQAARD
jgi:hypothetical protein